MKRGLKADTQMDIGANESFLSFAAGDWQMVARLLTGQFPNYEAVIPKAGNKTLTVDTAELKGALSRVAQMADVLTSAVKFSLDAETALQSSSPEYGEATEQIEAEYTGEPLAIGFNATYLLDFLAHTSGKVEAVFSDENSAGLFRIAGRSDYQYVVMPMRV
jgi:DNA polymerase-3 subunit beta